MPKRKKLSEDEIEIHRALEESVSDQEVVVTDLVALPDGSTLDMTALCNRVVERELAKKMQAFSQLSANPKSSLVGLQPKGISGASLVEGQPQVAVNLGGGQPKGCLGSSFVGLQNQGSLNNPLDLSEGVSMTVNPSHELSDSSCDSDQDSDESELDDVIGDRVNLQDEDGSSGISVAQLLEDCFGKSPSKQQLPSDTSVPPQAGGQSVPSTSQVNANPAKGSGKSEEPSLLEDPDLPNLDSNTSNWTPNPLVIKWAKKCFDKFMTKDEIKKLEDEFIPDPTIKDLFSPIRSSDRLNKTMQSDPTKVKDTFLFNRYECERRCFKAQHLLGLSFAPFLEALSNLSNVPESGKARSLIGQGLMAASSAWHEVSYARRELCRCFIKSDVASQLYKNPPTHNQLFGGDSIDDQVKLAIAKAKDEGSYIYKPINKQKFQPKSSGFQNRGKTQNSQKSGNRSKKGKGRQQRGKGKGKSQPKSSAAPDETNN